MFVVLRCHFCFFIPQNINSFNFPMKTHLSIFWVYLWVFQISSIHKMFSRHNGPFPSLASDQVFCLISIITPFTGHFNHF
jgi:hypothetical protein